MIITSVLWLLFLLHVILFGLALQKGKRKQFYSDTPFLFLFGIFIWGDALILSPFWMASSLLFHLLSLINICRYWLLFFAVRSMFEVIYWINHQVAHRDYKPPLFRNVKWLAANDSAILYQVMNMCLMIFSLALLLFSFISF
jgi:hypothetical protein